MKGVILAGGTGSRLYPLTSVTNKHLLPVYNKPMIFYPLELLREAGIKDILVVSGGENISDFLKLLGSGRQYDVNLTYKVQDGSGGIPVALSLAKDFIGDDKFVAILGDNIMDGSIRGYVESFGKSGAGAKILLKKVDDPHRYGLAEVRNGKVVGMQEKPAEPKSDLAICGIYLLDKKAFGIIPKLKPSKRAELEITEVLQHYVDNNDLEYEIFEGFWIDAGTFDALHTASKFMASKKA
ncbi:NTP transferase domain-containing protein [Candidatus Woesearchaeota archaeon]|nr:NTP transferase domain-containing protein [Candidatus Woesearchaeota archaeon]